MNRQEISEKVRTKVSENLGFSFDECTEGAKLQNDLAADSFDLVELIIDLEVMFKIKITDTEGELIVTVKDCVDLIERKLK